MNKDNRDPEYPTELETQFVLRLPEEPAKVLRNILKSGENLKDRLKINIEKDVRHGEVLLDHWRMHANILELPTIIESLKTIDNKNFYKTADICQIMVCKDEPDKPRVEEESHANKKKDPHKVDKKFLWPHGITPPTKNVRKRRFRKTLKKKCVESPEVEKEVKRLLSADNEAISVTWELVSEDDDQYNKSDSSISTNLLENKPKTERAKSTLKDTNVDTSNVVDIFGGAVSDSEDEDNGKIDSSHLSACNSIHGINVIQSKSGPMQFDSDMFQSHESQEPSTSFKQSNATSSNLFKSGVLSTEDDGDYQSRDMSKDNMTVRIEQLKGELDEMKQRRQQTKHEITNMGNLALRQRFQEILHRLNQDIMYKEMEYQGLQVLQNSEDI